MPYSFTMSAFDKGLCSQVIHIKLRKYVLMSFKIWFHNYFLKLHLLRTCLKVISCQCPIV